VTPIRRRISFSQPSIPKGGKEKAARVKAMKEKDGYPPSLRVGIEGEVEWIVEERHLASYWGEGLANAFGTPMLVALCEEASRVTVEKFLEEGQKTVGSWISLRHLAPTPQGAKVKAKAKLVGIEGRRLTFKVEAWDEWEKIGEADHERVIVSCDAFQARMEKKMRGST